MKVNEKKFKENIMKWQKKNLPKKNSREISKLHVRIIASALNSDK